MWDTWCWTESGQKCKKTLARQYSSCVTMMFFIPACQFPNMNVMVSLYNASQFTALYTQNLKNHSQQRRKCLFLYAFNEKGN